MTDDLYYRKLESTSTTDLVDMIRERDGCIEELEEENEKLKEQIEKMKCCENCKYNSYWGNELHCNYGLKEALQEDKLVECDKMDKWEIKEK